ncbi:50S ribosomal protein L32 [Candidatus Poribacteria bacterium]|nr:50S ribosomal protein L32 [Candidatus Poribacteria bacterium]
MAVPKRKTSKSRRNKRRSHDSLKARSVNICPNCSEVKLPHRACPECGYYRGRQAFEITEEE